MPTNPFSPESIKSAIDHAIATNILPPEKTTVLLVAPTVQNGQLVIKATAATKVGEHWQLGGDIDWHVGGDIGAGISVAASW